MRSPSWFFAFVLLFTACGDDTTTPPKPDVGPVVDGPVVDQEVTPDGRPPDSKAPQQLCAFAETLALTDGAARVVRAGTWLQPMVGDPQCAGSAAAAAPKMLFKFAATKDQWYRLTLDTRFAAYLYAFSNTACTSASIEADCKSGDKGDAIGPVAANSVGVLYLKAPADGEIYAVIKAAEAAPQEFFVLSVDAIAAPTNATCAAAKHLPFFGGKAADRGDTQPKLTPDEFSGLRCGGTADLDGPQAYYSFSAKQGTSYKISVNPAFTGHLYLFSAASACTQAAIESDCASAGVSGRFEQLQAGQANDVYFIAPQDGDYKIGIDSEGPDQAGSFQLGVEEDVIEPPDNYKCANAKAVVFTAGKATYNATTIGGFNEYGTDIKCGGTTALAGPQVYYKLTAKPKKAYRIKLTPKFSAYLYVFTAAGCGVSGTINSDCGSVGVSGDKMGAIASSSSKTLFFRPANPGDFLIAVDASTDTTIGNFDLEVEELDPPANDTCAAATPITLTAGKAQIAANTAFTLDEFATLRCGGSTDFDGPQVYYSLTLTQGKLYKIQLASTFAQSYLYLFRKSANCAQAAIEADCASGGVDGGKIGPISANGSAALYFIPPSTGDYVLGIDSSAHTYFGDFKVDIEESTPAANTSCANAKTLTLGATGVTEIGTTVGSPNEFGTAIKCGGTTAIEGGQVYYKVDLKTGGDYRIKLSPDFAARLYAFSAASACDPAKIETDCAGTTQGGNVTVAANSKGTLNLLPAADGTFYVVVDSATAGASGGFTLEIVEFVVPTLVAPFTQDFETDGGALAATGDWEWGTLNWVGASCDFTATPPTGGYVAGQSKMWGTVLNDCFNNLDNADGSCTGCDTVNKDDDSVLAFKVDLTQGACATASSATLTFQHYLHQTNGCDRAMFLINGVVDATQSICSGTSGGWKAVTFDLTPQLKGFASVALHFVASDNTNAAGWYIDEIKVTCQ